MVKGEREEKTVRSIEFKLTMFSAEFKVQVTGLAPLGQV